MSSQTTACSIISTLTTRSSTLANNTAAGLSVLAACTADVRLWYLQNSLQLNPDNSEVLAIGTTQQLHAASSAMSSVSVTGVDLPTADKMKVLRVDRA